MVNGIINVYKEPGYTSFDVVARLRGIFKQKKIGHTGTLDPDAEGVLPVCLGKATKVCDLLTDKDKEYRAVMLLGKVTDTQDISGQVLRESPVLVSKEQVLLAVERFVGDSLQIPPMYSALKVGGKKLCDLAREGITVERKARPITIFSITVESIDLPRVTMKVHCSKGTYIRTLCEDIGEQLGCGACMEKLKRTRVADFLLEDALTLSQIEKRVKECSQEIQPEQWNSQMFPFMNSIDSVFQKYPKAVASEQYAVALYNGNPLTPQMFVEYQAQWEQTWIRVYNEADAFIGIYQYAKEKDAFKPQKVFMDL